MVRCADKCVGSQFLSQYPLAGVTMHLVLLFGFVVRKTAMELFGAKHVDAYFWVRYKTTRQSDYVNLTVVFSFAIKAAMEEMVGALR